MIYAEFLKMNPYHGMPVTCTIEGKEITDAKLSRDDEGGWYLCQKTFHGSAPKDRLGYKYAWRIFYGNDGEDEEMSPFITNLKPMACDPNDRLTNSKPNKEKPMTNNTHPLADLKAGDYLNKADHYLRVLSDVHHPELGELATVMVSGSSASRNHEYLKYSEGWRTLFQLEEDGYKKLPETPRTIDDVLATLSDEDRKIVEEKIK